jgi:hypothetical protein
MGLRAINTFRDAQVSADDPHACALDPRTDFKNVFTSKNGVVQMTQLRHKYSSLASYAGESNVWITCGVALPSWEDKWMNINIKSLDFLAMSKSRTFYKIAILHVVDNGIRCYNIRMLCVCNIWFNHQSLLYHLVQYVLLRCITDTPVCQS